MNTTSFRMLKYIIKQKDRLDVNKIVTDLYSKTSKLDAYRDLIELKELGYITIWPLDGLVVPVSNIRGFYDHLNDFDFLSDINAANVVKPTLRGIEYAKAKRFEKITFWIPLIISILSTVLSILFTIIYSNQSVN